MNIAVLILLLSARFIRRKKAEVSKRQYSSKAKGSNVREGGGLSNPCARAARVPCRGKYENLWKPARAPRALCIDFFAAKNTVVRPYHSCSTRVCTHTCFLQQASRSWSSDIRMSSMISSVSGYCILA